MLNPFSGERSHTATDALRAEPPTRQFKFEVIEGGRQANYRPTPFNLTDRQMQIIEFPIGTRVKDIAAELDCSHLTVKCHIRAALGRMGGLKSRDEAHVVLCRQTEAVAA